MGSGRPDRLALFWNVHLPPAEISEAFNRVYGARLAVCPLDDARHRGVLQVLHSGGGRIRAVEGFGHCEEWRFDWEETYTRDEWLDQVPTAGGHSRFPPATLAELLAGIGEAIDHAGGSFVMHYATAAVTAPRP